MHIYKVIGYSATEVELELLIIADNFGSAVTTYQRHTEFNFEVNSVELIQRVIK